MAAARCEPGILAFMVRLSLLLLLAPLACNADTGTTDTIGASSTGATTSDDLPTGADTPGTTTTTSGTSTTSITTTQSGTTPTGSETDGTTGTSPSQTTDVAGTTTGETSTSTDTTADTTTADTTTGADDDVYDPDKDGPWQISKLAGSVMVGNVAVAIAGYYPTEGPQVGPFPVVVVAHGFQLPPSQYTTYVQRLATHGYVAVTADYKAELFASDHVANAAQVLAGIDWVAAEPALAGIADTNNVGLTGHSLGGKLAIYGAVMDGRVRASITLDPVDGAQMCTPQKCPDVSDMLPTDIPLGFVGETLDGAGGFMPCAPSADNFLTFFAQATAPALAVTVQGANHMSFLDDVDTCGFVCSFCQQPTLTNDVVNALSRAYVVAFYGRHLKGNPGYDTYLTGAIAQERYVETGLVELAEK